MDVGEYESQHSPADLGEFFMQCHGILVVVLVMASVGRSTSAFGQQIPIDASPWRGEWVGRLRTPGGDIEFGLSIEAAESSPSWTATLRNAEERIPLSDVRIDAEGFTLGIPHYDSELQLRWTDEGTSAAGRWTKRRSAMQIARLPVELSRPVPIEDVGSTEPFEGRWRVEFIAGQEPAVGIFERGKAPGHIRGTFLTPTGDYRYLGGVVRGEELVLARFDDAHAFLFRARTAADGKLEGDFWSGDWFHDTWRAERDAKAELPDAFGLTVARSGVALHTLAFPDLEGNLRSLGDRTLRGRVTIIELFGSWCPNCHDAAAWLGELSRGFTAEELRIVGLAFELTGDRQRDAQQVRHYVKRHSIGYPVLLAGIADKEKAAKQFPLLDRIRAYPTFLFLDESGTVRAIYTGFAGPATGEAYGELRQQFRETIRNILDQPDLPSRD